MISGMSKVMIFSDSQGVLQAVGLPKVTSVLICKCRDTMIGLAQEKDIKLLDARTL